MDEEGLVELREFPLDKTSADHVNNPELDFFAGNVETAGDHVVGKFTVRGRGGQGGEGQEADFAEGSRVVDSCNPFTKIRYRRVRGDEWGKQTVVVNPAVMLVVKLLVVFEISTDEDFQEGIRLRIAGGQLLDSIQCD